MSGPKRKSIVTVGEVDHEVDPRDPKVRRPSTGTTGTGADALLDDAAGRPKSETEAALERATDEDRSRRD